MPAPLIPGWRCVTTTYAAPNFFDVAKYPTLTFKSKSVEAAGSGKLKVTGDLTIHGVTKEVVLDVDGPSAPVTGSQGELPYRRLCQHQDQSHGLRSEWSLHRGWQRRAHHH